MVQLLSTVGGDEADGCKRKCLLPLANPFLHQFIPLVHHLLFLRMYSSYDYVRQNMYYIVLMYRGLVHPS